MNKIKIKRVNRNESTVRLPNQTLNSLRYLLGNMSHNDLVDKCRDLGRANDLTRLFAAFEKADFRSSKEDHSEMSIDISDAAIAKRLQGK